MMIKYIEVLVLLVLCLVTDLTHYKIKNRVTMPFIVIGILTNGIISGFTGIGDAVLGVIVPFIILFLFFAMKGIGAGDIKEIMAIGAILGIRSTVNCIFYIFIIGAIISLIVMIKNKILVARIKYFCRYIVSIFKIGKLMPYRDT